MKCMFEGCKSQAVSSVGVIVGQGLNKDSVFATVTLCALHQEDVKPPKHFQFSISHKPMEEAGNE